MMARTVDTACRTAPRIVTAFVTKRQVFVLLASRDGKEIYVQTVRVATLVDLYFLGLIPSNFQLRKNCLHAIIAF